MPPLLKCVNSHGLQWRIDSGRWRARWPNASSVTTTLLSAGSNVRRYDGRGFGKNSSLVSCELWLNLLSWSFLFLHDTLSAEWLCTGSAWRCVSSSVSTGRGLCSELTSPCCRGTGPTRCPLSCCAAHLRLRVALFLSRYRLLHQSYPSVQCVRRRLWYDQCCLLFLSQGVYRVSGSKPRIQKHCQAFEIQKDQVDLTELSPHDITSILKHFFKEVEKAGPRKRHWFKQADQTIDENVSLFSLPAPRAFTNLWPIRRLHGCGEDHSAAGRRRADTRH